LVDMEVFALRLGRSQCAAPHSLSYWNSGARHRASSLFFFLPPFRLYVFLLGNRPFRFFFFRPPPIFLPTWPPTTLFFLAILPPRDSLLPFCLGFYLFLLVAAGIFDVYCVSPLPSFFWRTPERRFLSDLSAPLQAFATLGACL